MNILDLPDEILLYILNKLNNMDILYSFVDVNPRFDRLALDPIYTADFDLSVIDKCEKSNEHLDRFCTSILPRIHHRITKLTLGQLSIERLLHNNIDYCQLYSLSLVLDQVETIANYITGDTILIRLLNKQITDFNLTMNFSAVELFDRYEEPRLFELIVSFGKCLIDLTFQQCIRHPWKNSLFNLLSKSCASSTLTKLKIDVNTLDDCLFILAGHFDCLSTLTIDIKKIQPLLSNIDTTQKLLKLKYFSLTSVSLTSFYHELLPIFRRMPNLEELRLFLFVKRINSIYIDGIHLNDQILYYMPRLNKFTFSITTIACNRHSNVILPSNDDMQRSFVDKRYGQIGSYTDDNTMKIGARCHIYSLPYDFEMFNNVTNSFQGGIFDKVRSVTVTDDFRPFENEFFQIISNSFPFLRRLTIQNDQPPKYKQSSFKQITFAHLAILDLKWAHIDYVEQFLLRSKIGLPCLSYLSVQQESLAVIKNNFPDHANLFNFAQLKILL